MKNAISGNSIVLAAAVALGTLSAPAAAQDRQDRMRIESGSDRGCLQVGLGQGMNPDSGHSWRNVVTTENCRDQNNIWTVEGNRIYTMAGQKRFCLDVDRGAQTMGPGLNVIVYEDCHGGSNQQWTRQADGTIRVSFRNQGNELCLDPQGTPIRTDGYGGGKVRNVHAYLCGGQPWQSWEVTQP